MVVPNLIDNTLIVLVADPVIRIKSVGVAGGVNVPLVMYVCFDWRDRSLPVESYSVVLAAFDVASMVSWSDDAPDLITAVM